MKLLLYCTKAKPYLYKTEDTTYPAYPIGYHTDKYLKVKLSNTNELANLNGKIVAECDYEVEEIELLEDSNATMITNTLSEEELLKKSCLEGYELCNYLYDNLWCGQKGYAIHIKNLYIFDKPKELSKCYYLTLEKGFLRQIKKAPQNMCYALTTRDDKDILISIKPEWLCKILNGEKTVEVRKKVLKEMIKCL